jgi:hypothetical protein
MRADKARSAVLTSGGPKGRSVLRKPNGLRTLAVHDPGQ